MKKKILFAIFLCGMLLAVLSTAAMAEGFVCEYCKTNNTAFLEYRNANDGTGKHYAWYICNNSGCGKTMRDDNSGSYHSGGTATCTHGKYCAACGAEYGLFGHTSEEGARPTCQQRRVCKVCHEEFGELGNHEIVKYYEIPATCQKEGRTECSYCIVPGCSYKEGGQAIPKTDHRLKEAREFTREPTCLKVGWKSYYLCKDCSYSTTDWVNALGHDPIPHVAQTPTCTEIGWDEYDTCKRSGCNYTTYRELPALNHDRVHHDAKIPTCTEIGWDAYDTCTRCEYTTYVGLPINSSNHDLEHHAAKTPTCTEIGWNEYDTCKRCNYTTYQELPALEHDYQQTVVKPACEKDGYTRYTCSRCKDTYTEDAVEKLYHWYGEWSPNGDETHSAGCRREGCKHTGTTDCQKFKFQVEENESLIFCPVCGEVRNGERLELIAGSLVTVITGGIPAGGSGRADAQ